MKIKNQKFMAFKQKLIKIIWNTVFKIKEEKYFGKNTSNLVWPSEHEQKFDI